MIKRLICTVLASVSLFVSCAYAEFVPTKSMGLLEAMGIENVSEVNGAYMLSLEKAKAMKLSQEQIDRFFVAAVGVTLERRINKNPFSGVCIVLQTDGGEKTYFLNSGVQVGKFGEENFLCYSTKESNDIIEELFISFMSSDERYDFAQFTINESLNFLNFPTEKWAVPEVMYSAANSLLPYETMDWFGRVMSREAFCILIANFITANRNYAQLDDYFKESGTAYLTNYFSDTENCDDCINMLHALGIVSGKSSDLFAPDDALTREEAAVIFKKTVELLGISGKNEAKSFADSSSISPWAVDSIDFVATNGLMNGTDGMFSPKQYITAEQAIAAVNRLYKLGKSNR